MLLILLSFILCGWSPDESTGEPGIDGPFYQSMDGVVVNPAMMIFADDGFASLTYANWKQDSHGGQRGDIGASLKSRDSYLALSVLGEDPGPRTLGLRLGVSSESGAWHSDGVVGLLTDDGGALEYTQDYTSKGSSSDAAILLGVRPFDSFVIAAQLITSERRTKSTAGNASIRDGSIQYSQVQWSAAWRSPGGEGHEVGLSYRPRVQLDEGVEGSIDQERILKVGYSRALQRSSQGMNMGFALSWHDYSRVDSRLDTKASYDFSFEKLLGEDLVGLDWSWQPAYYGTADSVSPSTIGQSVWGLRHARHWISGGGHEIDTIAGVFYGPRSSRSESDNGRVWDATAGAVSGFRLGLRYFF